MAKICLITSFVFSHGGEQRVTVVIANELAKENHVVIYSMDEPAEYDKNPYHLDKEVEARQIHIPKFGLWNRILRRIVREFNERTDWFYQNPRYLKLLEYAYFQKSWQDQILAELTKEPYDVIMAVSGGNTIQLGMIADRLPCRTVGWEHNAFEAYFRTPGLYFWHQDVLFGESIRRLDQCVVLNENIRQKYMEAFGKDCKVIYNPRSFVSREKSKLVNKTFVACGRLIYQKGFDLLLDSFHYFSSQDDEWKLVIVGDGDMRRELESKIAEYHLEKRVHITGYTDDVKPYLQEASIYLLSSRWEGFPMVLTEAFEMGLPVVAYDITAVDPLVTDQQEGLLVRAFDTRQFAEKMLYMTGLTAEERQIMALKAIEKAKSLAVENIMIQWKELLGIDQEGRENEGIY